MIRLLKLLGSALYLLLVAALLAPVLVPPFLDAVYYAGPETAHFDGERFFNPDGDADAEPTSGPGRSRGPFLARLIADEGTPPWPGHVAVEPTGPPPRVGGDRMLVTWVGHSTALVQTQGLNILTDPIWSEHASPFPPLGPRRVAAPGIRFDDLPRIDLVLVSHNHYDHMDLPTLERLWRRDRPLVVTSLGNDTVLAAAGIRARALDWGERLRVSPAVSVVVARNHHWGSRWFVDRNRALWSSFVVETPAGNVFFAGDTGPGDMEWPAEAAALGPVRLALIPIGAFRFGPGQLWSDSHIGPYDAARVWNRLGRPAAIGIHWGTFRLSWESYATPPRMLDALLDCAGRTETPFAAVRHGRSIEVPPLRPSPPLDEDRLGACLDEPAVTTLR